MNSNCITIFLMLCLLTSQVSMGEMVYGIIEAECSAETTSESIESLTILSQRTTTPKKNSYLQHHDFSNLNSLQKEQSNYASPTVELVSRHIWVMQFLL